MAIRTPPIRYAVAERFGRPRPAGDGAASGDLCPQLPSRLDVVMGPPVDPRVQSEDCLHLVVTTPAQDTAGRPVLVWLHGGGFNSGSGLLEWYDAGELADEGDVVVVGVNYRLGAFGYLVLDGVAEGNMGLHDQVEALRWVRTNIARFGGDPDRVTVMGQSAGGMSIAVLAELPQARGLFGRAIVQSAPVGLATRTREHAESVGRRWADELDADPRDADPAAMLAALRATASWYAGETGSAMATVFGPVEPGRSTFAGNVAGIDVLYGWNADEATAFPGADTERDFADPVLAFAGRLDRAGARTHGYRIDWRPAGSPWGATHCVELPLLLGTRRAWAAAPMLGTTPWAEISAFGTALRSAWACFARTGVPGDTGPDLPISRVR